MTDLLLDLIISKTINSIVEDTACKNEDSLGYVFCHHNNEVDNASKTKGNISVGQKLTTDINNKNTIKNNIKIPRLIAPFKIYILS